MIVALLRRKVAILGKNGVVRKGLARGLPVISAGTAGKTGLNSRVCFPPNQPQVVR